MARRPERPLTMAEIVQEVEESGPPARGPVVHWPSPIRDGEWTDAAGVVYRRRGARLFDKQTKKLLAQEGVVLLHAYAFDVGVVEGDERAALLARVDTFLRDEGPPFGWFDFAEFRSPDRVVMLVVEESC